MGRKNPDPRTRLPRIGDLAQLLAPAGPIEEPARGALPLLAVLAGASDGALFLPGPGQPPSWGRQVLLGEESLFPDRLPGSAFADAAAGPPCDPPRGLDPAVPLEAGLLERLRAAGRRTALLVPFHAQGRLFGFCLLADPASLPLGGRRARTLGQAGLLLGLRLAAAAHAEAARELELRFADLSRSSVDRNITDWFQAKRIMEETLTGTCEALGRMVELRDPYTKGHSVRVAAIAVLLGERLGHSPYELQGLQLMGLLHDIGKVGIPTEILSKPTRLGPEELELMRQHPRMGYEILKDISFPWPVAAAVLQHHERLDGSGYPQGLTGAELMWQVRLLAVADLLEAMATDRPYRPGLGLEVALRELEQQRGLLFDAEIVDAALAAAGRGELAALMARESLPAAAEPASPFPAAAARRLESDLEPVPSA